MKEGFLCYYRLLFFSSANCDIYKDTECEQSYFYFYVVNLCNPVWIIPCHIDGQYYRPIQWLVDHYFNGSNLVLVNFCRGYMFLHFNDITFSIQSDLRKSVVETKICLRTLTRGCYELF